MKPKKRLSDRTAPFVGAFSGLVGLARIVSNPPDSAGEWAAFVGVLAGIAGLIYLLHRTVSGNNRRARAALATAHLPFTMVCDVDTASLKRFGGWSTDPRLKQARYRCMVASDGNTLAVEPVAIHTKGPRPCTIDISHAGPGSVGQHMSEVRPALIIPVPGPDGVQPLYLISPDWSKSGIHQSPLARFATALPA